MTPRSGSLIYRHRTSNQRRQVFAGNRKAFYDGAEAGTYVLQFKDQFSLSESDCPDLQGKGAINNRISELFLSRLNEIGLETHFIKRINMSEQLVKSCETIPLRLTVYNVAVDDLSERLGLDNPHLLSSPIIEFSYQSRDLKYPVVSQDHIEALNWADADEVEEMIMIARRVNDFLNGHFYALDLRLLNFSLEFGRVYDYLDESSLLIVDEISPDTCAILDLKTSERLDGRVFETVEPMKLVQNYQEIAKRLGLLEDGGPLDLRDPIIYTGEVQVTDGVIHEEDLTMKPLVQSSVLSFSERKIQNDREEN